MLFSLQHQNKTKMMMDTHTAAHERLLELDELRQQFEREGKFLQAQECVNRMREQTLREGRRLQDESKRMYHEERGALTQQHQLELHDFVKKWEDRLAEYEGHAHECLAQLQAKHTNEYHDQENTLKLQMMNKRPRFSKQVIQLRTALEKVVQQRKYIEADEIKRKLVPLEQKEVAEFDAALQESFLRRTQMLKTQFQNEFAVLKQKIRLGKEELNAQRKSEYEKLLHRQSNSVRELDSRAKLETSKTTDYVQRQIRVMVQNPQRTTAHLKHYDPMSSSSQSMTPSRRSPSLSTFRSPHRQAAGGMSSLSPSRGLGRPANPTSTGVRAPKASATFSR